MRYNLSSAGVVNNLPTFYIGRNFATTIPRKFGVRYNPYTLSVEILDNANQMAQYAGDIKGILLHVIS